MHRKSSLPDQSRDHFAGHDAPVTLEHVREPIDLLREIMERIALTGWSLSHCSVDQLERAKQALALAGSSAARILADELAASELVVISTCNRLEFAYAREAGDWPAVTDKALLCRALQLHEDDPLIQSLSWTSGAHVAKRLFEVIASLDSLVLGESQIQTQIRQAFEHAREQALVGPLLAPLFQQAVRCGREVRRRTQIAHGSVSVVSLAAQALEHRFAGRSPCVAVVGSGEMARAFLHSLPAHGLRASYIVNRRVASARELASQCQARALGLEEFLQGGAAVDAILCATSAQEPILCVEFLERSAQQAPLGTGLLVVDVSMPRNVAACTHPQVTVVDLDGLRSVAALNRDARERAAQCATRIVDEHVQQWTGHRTDSGLGAAMEAVHEESTGALERELALLNKHLAGSTGDQERAAIERWARSAMGRIAHVSIAAVKEFARANRSTRSAQDALLPQAPTTESSRGSEA